jgi:CspA family cold shock protein
MAATAITDRTNHEGGPLAATTTAEATTTDKASRVTGTVRWFSHKGFGFIDRHGGGDVYVHHSGIVGSGFRTLATGAVVQFSVRQTRRGPEAVDVVVIEDPD